LSLLSLSPLLSSLFVSYAGRAASAGSTPTTSSPSPESDEWRSLRDTVAVLREENEKLKSEIREIAGKLEVAEAFQEILRSQVLSLKDLNTNREEEVKSLQEQVSEAQQKYDRLAEDSNAEKAALKVQVSDLEVGLESCLVVD
jgi:predicted RNase H-like nuclease (RuvC/YqgF family)